MKLIIQPLLACILLLSSNLLFAQDISVDSPYVRAIPPGQTISAAFMTLKNSSKADISLVKASSDIAEHVELHEHVHEDGMMKMRKVPQITIAASSEAHLKPGGYHIMLIGLKQAIKPSDVIDINLEFSDGSQQAIKAEVKKIAMGMMHKPDMKANMAAMKHSNPMPNLMKVIIKHPSELTLTDDQSTELKKWRDAHMPASKQLAAKIITLETELHKAAMDNKPLEKIDQLANEIMKNRTKIIHGKALCRDNMKKILSDEQFDTVLKLYTANFITQ